MTLHLTPGDAAEVAEIVAQAGAEGRTFEIIGHGSRRRLGGRLAADAVLDLSRLSGVVAYEPNELVLTVKPATPLAEIQALLAAENQHLAFEPPDYGPLWGEPAGLGTVGGMIGVGHGGPRRPFAGAPRDHLLGFKAVNGAGEPFAAGGRVVKNVTGFDLPKLMTGAFGTLGVLTEVTLKVLPAPQASRTLLFGSLDDAAGLALLRRVIAGPIPVAGAAHLPARSQTLIRVEGMAAVLPLAIDRLRAALEAPAAEILAGPASAELWRGIGGGAPFAGADTPVWRVALPPSGAAGLGAELHAAGMALYYDWGGRLIWVEGPRGTALGGGDVIRTALARHAPDGHATLIRGDEALRTRVSPLQPQSPGVAALSARLKARFDPHGLFNPGRMDGAY